MGPVVVFLLMRRRLLAVLGLTFLWPSMASGEAQTVASLTGGVASMSAWRGHVVFSQFDTKTERWSLMHATRRGVARLSVRPQNAPFDADVGSDSAGRPAAVFSRCPRSGPIVSSYARLPGTSGCRIFVIRLDIATARSRVVRSLAARRFSDGAPTLWRGRVAFGRVINGGTMAAVFIQRRAGSRQLLRLGRGTIPTCRPAERRCYRVAAPRSMDLRGSRLSFVWALAGGNAFPQVNEELWIESANGSAGRLLDVGGAGECGFGPYSFRFFGQPFLNGRSVSYLAYRGDCRLTDSTFTESGPDARTRRERDSASSGAPRTIAYDAARDSTGWWSIRGPEITVTDQGRESRPCDEGLCKLVHSNRISLRPVRVARQPRPPVGPAR